MTKHENNKTWVRQNMAQSRQSLVNMRKELENEMKKTTLRSHGTHGVTTYLQRQATQVKGDGEVRGGFEADVAKVDV